MSFPRGFQILSLAGLPLLSMLLSGCAGGKADVTGEVRFKGQPLSVGRISFFSDTEKKPVLTAWIVRGKYTLKGCPVGPAKISIESMRPPKRSSDKADKNVPSKELLKGFEPTKLPPELEELFAGEPVKYMPIPPRFANPETSRLEYVVQRGPQTHNIDLTP
jgi:hypothetical protein